MRRKFKNEKYPQSCYYFRGTQYNFFKSNVLTCFECGFADHFIKDFLKKKNEDKKEYKRKDLQKEGR